jgi:hypothetical protein
MATNPLRCISNPISGVESMEFIIKLGFFRIFDLLLTLVPIRIVVYQAPRNLELAGIAAVSSGNQSLPASPTNPQLQ